MVEKKDPFDVKRRGKAVFRMYMPYKVSSGGLEFFWKLSIRHNYRYVRGGIYRWE